GVGAVGDGHDRDLLAAGVGGVLAQALLELVEVHAVDHALVGAVGEQDDDVGGAVDVVVERLDVGGRGGGQQGGAAAGLDGADLLLEHVGAPATGDLLAELAHRYELLVVLVAGHLGREDPQPDAGAVGGHGGG